MKKKDLVIVESPTKAKTVGKILGNNFVVVSSMGHLVDLPKKSLGVKVDANFEASYTVIQGRKKIIDKIKKEAKNKGIIYVATDPDREGEAIGWQIKNKILKGKNVLRVVFHEITSSAVKESFAKSRDFDENMVEAQAGRRILDRIVGYFLSPLLWRKLARGLSAGRVQSVALRLIVEREREIQKFLAKEYWEIEAKLKKPGTEDETAFMAKLDKFQSKKVEINSQEEAANIVALIKGNEFKVEEIKRSEKRRFPDPPFITSTLQQEAFNKLKFNSTKTMIVAQQLYEGIDIGEDGPVGLITYMRTDSTRVASEAMSEVRDLVLKRFGKDYLPQEPNIYKVKKFAQEAHEAIRPTQISRPAESLKDFLSAEQYKLYEIVYNRFVASQINPAVYLTTKVEIQAAEYLFNASGSNLIFDGFTAIYNKNNEEDEKKTTLPDLEKGEVLNLVELLASQHFTKPPARFSDSSLVKILEEEGIGRPSTYAPIVYTLIMRDYIRRIKGYFHPSELGFKVVDLLVEYFPSILDTKFTATMEEKLDDVEEGKFDKIKVLNDFFPSFKKSLDFAQDNIKKEVIVTNEVCDQCGKPMVVKWGRKGKFLSCSGFPDCKKSKSITTGVKCPEPDCGGELIERRSRRGFFFGCSNYPKCTHISNTLPQTEKTATE